jgi:hypothetical protein
MASAPRGGLKIIITAVVRSLCRVVLCERWPLIQTLTMSRCSPCGRDRWYDPRYRCCWSYPQRRRTGYPALPSHNHLINVNNTPGTGPNPTNNIQAEAATGDPRNPTLISQFTAASPTGTMAPTTVSMAGGGQPHANIQPYLTVNFIIALQGIFPSRG